MNKDLDFTTILGIEEFAPHYQFEKGLAFNALVEYYLDQYFNPAEPERYLSKLRHAVRFANKSIMLEKLGLDYVDDLEAKRATLFKSKFLQLASSDPNLIIKGENIAYSPDLAKSFGDAPDPTAERNSYYERLWKSTFDALQTESQT